MPWPNLADREEVDTKFKTMRTIKKGQVTYLFYKRFIELWDKTPRYDTIHFIGLLRYRPERDEIVWNISKECLFKGLTKSDIDQCRSDAHHQIERLHFDIYESLKRRENGPVGGENE